MLREHLLEWISRDVRGLHQPLLATLLVGDHDNRAPRGTLLVQRF
jgi:hypothetical protein